MPYVQYTLVQSHGFVYDGNKKLVLRVEVHGVLDQDACDRVRKAGGKLFTDYRVAQMAAMHVNTEGFYGRFSDRYRVDGLPVWVPERRDRGSHLG